MSVTMPPAVKTSASEAGRLAAEAAGRSAMAAALAAENASKPGATSSEFKMTLLSIGLAALFGGIKAFTVIPGPWQIPAVVLLAISGSAAAYATSRGKVKSAALAATTGMVGEGEIVATSAALTATGAAPAATRYSNPG